MSPEMTAIIAVSIVAVLIIVLLLQKVLPKPLKQKKFIKKWRELQLLCKDKASWREAIIAADELLDKALRRKKFKGSRPGERMVSAQRKFSNNDELWSAHNLYKKLLAKPELEPKENETKQALKAFRQALRDLGALPRE